MRKASILVRAQWDDEAGVWIATSEDVPGLVAEAASQDLLLEKLRIMIPELLALNGNDYDLPEVPLVVMSEQMTKVRIRANG